MSGGRRLVAVSAALVCGAGTLLFALALARDEPLPVLAVLAVAIAAGIVVARLLPDERRAPRTRTTGDPGPKSATLPPAAHTALSIPLAPIGASLEPTREVSEPFERLARLVRESAPPGALIQITSPMVGEGKTTVATNLAAALAAVGDRVLVVDAHPDRMRAHRMLGAQPRFVDNGRPLREYVVPTHLERVDLFCAGNSQTYGRVSLDAIWRDLANDYDLTLIDTSGGLSRSRPDPVERADLNIVVARADHTPAHLIEIALRRLEPDATIVVLNAAPEQPKRRSRAAAQQRGA